MRQFVSSIREWPNPRICRRRPRLLAAGQITGTEGYAAAVAGGWLAGTNAARLALGQQPLSLPATTMIGALTHFIAEAPSGEHDHQRVGVLPTHLVGEDPHRVGVEVAALAAAVAEAAESVIPL